MKIRINKFGPIVNTDMEFAPLVLITGNSNLGKSYANSLYYYIVEMLLNRFSDFVKNRVDKNSIKGILTFSSKDVLGWLNTNVERFVQDFYGYNELKCDVKYEIEENENHIFNISYQRTSISDKKNDNDLDVEQHNVTEYIFSYTFEEDNRTIRVPDLIDISTLLGVFISRKVLNILCNTDVSSCMMLPPARGSLIGENYSFLEKITATSGMYKYFIRDNDKHSTFLRINSTVTNSERIAKLIGGTIIKNKEEFVFMLPTGVKLPITAAASSIKELSPLVMAVQNSNRNARLSFCLEEPEAHLHPELQIGIADIIASLVNRGNYFQITTHSDYIMQRFNQLIKLHSISEKDKREALNICKKYEIADDSILSPKKVITYYFSRNENGDAVVKKLNVDKMGIPMDSFFSVVSKLNNIEDSLIDVMNKE